MRDESSLRLLFIQCAARGFFRKQKQREVLSVWGFHHGFSIVIESIHTVATSLSFFLSVSV